MAKKSDKPKKPGVFDIISNLNMGNQAPHVLEDLPASNAEALPPNDYIKAYSTFMVNRAFSQHIDTVMLANEMNQAWHLPVRMQYDFYHHTIRPSKRYGKWAKASNKSKVVELIMERYDYSRTKAEQVADLYDSKAIKELKQYLNKGKVTK